MMGYLIAMGIYKHNHITHAIRVFKTNAYYLISIR